MTVIVELVVTFELPMLASRKMEKNRQSSGPRRMVGYICVFRAGNENKKPLVDSRECLQDILVYDRVRRHLEMQDLRLRVSNTDRDQENTH